MIFPKRRPQLVAHGRLHQLLHGPETSRQQKGERQEAQQEGPRREAHGHLFAVLCSGSMSFFSKWIGIRNSTRAPWPLVTSMRWRKNPAALYQATIVYRPGGTPDNSNAPSRSAFTFQRFGATTIVAVMFECRWQFT